MKLPASERGFSLIELMVTVTVIAVLLILGAPSFGSSAATARERSVVQKFTQDFDWARGAAGVSTVTMTLTSACAWSTTVNGVVDAAHSMTAAAVSAQTPALACSAGTVALPATFAFTSQGFATPNGTLTFTGGNGQQWPLQVLFSGSIVRVRGAS